MSFKLIEWWFTTFRGSRHGTATTYWWSMHSLLGANMHDMVVKKNQWKLIKLQSSLIVILKIDKKDFSKKKLYFFQTHPVSSCFFCFVLFFFCFVSFLFLFFFCFVFVCFCSLFCFVLFSVFCFMHLFVWTEVGIL